MLFDNLVHHSVYRGVTVPLTAPAYDYLVAGNGLFKRAASPHVCAQIPVTLARVAGLPDLDDPVHVAVRPGRIPGRLLYAVLADARQCAWRHQEQMYSFAFEGQAVRLSRPVQRAGAAQVRYAADAGDGVVCDLHSHHTMGAFFSSTDDADEQGFRFYAVIGDVLGKPALRLRLGMYGDFLDLPATALFTGPGPFMDLFGAEEIDDGDPHDA